MSTSYQALVPEIKRRLVEEFQNENTSDTDVLLGLPYPFTASGKDHRNALYYWDTFFINQALIKFKLIDQARHNVENLIYLYRKLNFIPLSSHVHLNADFHPPLLPWMVRDIYRATGDKEWLRRVLPDAVREFQFWTTKPHTSSSGLYRYSMPKTGGTTGPENRGPLCSMRFPKPDQVNPVDLNAILYRNAKLLYDLQIEDSGQGDEQIIAKSEHIKKLFEICWDNQENFYFDNDLENKSLMNSKTLAGYMPLFVEMIDKNRAKTMIKQLEHFNSPGGLAFTANPAQADPTGANASIVTAPCVYFIVKGMCDYEYMEDALDIANRWLSMVTEVYEKTGEFWEWYDVSKRTHKADNGLENTPVMGWTAGTFIALMDTLGLEL